MAAGVGAVILATSVFLYLLAFWTITTWHGWLYLTRSQDLFIR